MSATSKSTETVSVRIPTELARKIEEKTEEHPYRVPKSEVIRAAIREHVED